MGELAQVWLPAKVVAILRQFLDGMMAQVMAGGHEAEHFGVCTGDRQGCALASVLFSILIHVTLLLHRSV